MFEIHTLIPDKSKEGKVSWRCPSNIAIIKYWGKHGRQLPKNASLSLTLSNAVTETTISYKSKLKTNKQISLTFLFEGQENDQFAEKIAKYLFSILDIFPFLSDLHFDISSSNSFPHSSGIASSASAMSAIAMCLCDIEKTLFNLDSIDLKKASFVARLGSGSASRSVIPLMSVWGQHPQIEGANDQYAVPIDDIDPIFIKIHDDILIVSESEKSVSSTAGHALMDNNVYAEARYKQANDRLSLLINAMKTGDIKTFGKIAEEEAMTLHALMMCSDPSYTLIEPNTLKVINEIKRYRKSTALPIYFTLDAGPNVHILYPDAIKNEAARFINEHLLKYSLDNKTIKDEIGNGPKKIF
ncbi:MAG: diphosphomevalonate decarboxylase [Saprospiraceae bacterium]